MRIQKRILEDSDSDFVGFRIRLNRVRYGHRNLEYSDLYDLGGFRIKHRNT